MAIIKLKKGFSGVTPTGLTLAEPAFDYKDSKLYVGLTATAVWVGAEIDNTTSLGTSQIKIPTQFAVKTYIDNLGLSPGVVVTGVNGVTGAVLLGVTSGPGLSIVNPTGSGKGITLINTGVLSVNGSTGAISNVAFTNVAQTFTGIQTFSSGITVSAASRYTGAQRFNDIRNRGNGVTLAITTDGDGIDAGFESKTDVAIRPYGDFVVAPTKVGIAVGGSSPRLDITNDDDASGSFRFSGGNIVVNLQSTASVGGQNSSIQFVTVGGTAGIFLRGITAASGANKIIQLPNHTGIVVVPANLGTSGNILRANGITAQPTWFDPTAAGFTVAGASTAVSLQGGAAGSLPYNTAANTTTFLGIGSANQILRVNAAGNAPEWLSPNSAGFTAFQATRAINIDGGAAGSLPYNTAANTTTFLGIGSNLTILRSNGSAPTWIDPSAAGFTAYGSTISVNVQGGAAGSLPYNTAANTTTFLGIGSA